MGSRQPATAGTRVVVKVNLNASQAKMLAWLCERFGQSKSGMLGTVLMWQYRAEKESGRWGE